MNDLRMPPQAQFAVPRTDPDAGRRLTRHVVIAACALLAVLVIGVAGYRALEDLTVIDGLYMTVITITTVGFGEIPHPFSPEGRLFTIALIFAGVSIAAYALSSAAQYIVSAEWQTSLANRKRRNMLAQLHDHIIVCGYGRVGTGVVHELLAERLPFVVIELEEVVVARLTDMGHLALQGNAADEALLLAAGIERARGIVVAANSDAENVYITLTARGLRPDINIVARASYEESEAKLLRAGADRVIMPFGIAGRRMVTMLVRPDVADFIDVISSAGGLELFVEQVHVAPSSPLAGQTLGEADLGNRLGVSVLAAHSPNTRLTMQPGPDTVLAPLTELVVLGTKDQLLRLTELSGHASGDVAEPIEDIPPLPPGSTARPS
jgi:voltage-gated potassium channel